ncbi:MAG: hypothetical protein RLZZ362_2589, partial [Actinomycetota bacterium]
MDEHRGVGHRDAGHREVVVVGAGLAGLRCATDLMAAGRDVVVLEARDRVGGRVLSHRFTNGQWCERGAEFVCGAHTEVLALVERFGLVLTDVATGDDDDARLLDMGGRTTPFSLHHSLVDDLGRWRAALDRLASTIDPADPASSPHAAELDALPLSALVDASELSLVARVVVGRDVRTEYMLGPDNVSQLMAAWNTMLQDRSGDGLEAHRIVGGNDQLASRLAAPLGDRIRLGQAVSMLSPDDGEVVLRSGERLTADHVVVTVPLPVLSRMWSDMPAALGRVGYGVGGKVGVQVSRRIWRDAGRDGGVVTERSWG